MHSLRGAAVAAPVDGSAVPVDGTAVFAIGFAIPVAGGREASGSPRPPAAAFGGRRPTRAEMTTVKRVLDLGALSASNCLAVVISANPNSDSGKVQKPFKN